MSPVRIAILAAAGLSAGGLLALSGGRLGVQPAGDDLAAASPQSSRTPQEDPWRVLVFSRTAGFRHDSIPAGIECVRRIGADKGFQVDATEDAADFTDDNLSQYAAVVFLNTTGDVLERAQEEAFERYIQAGGGYLGVHSAADTEYGWEWYGKLVGAYFRGHPAVQEATVEVVDRAHPATRHLLAQWIRTDEWYDFRSAPAPNVNILLKLDESTYEGGRMGDDHPIGWYHEFDGGRAIYTGGGHTKESFSEPEFVQHLAGAILWAAGKAQVDDPAP
jgi:type 1 glutamine amidotransferase